MKKHFLFLILSVLFISSVQAASNLPGFHNESEAGVVITSGNSSTQSYHYNQDNTYGFGNNLLRFNGKFLKSSSRSVEVARYWTLGLRYERELVNRFSIFLGQNIQSDPYAGYMQRYNTDIGGKYFIFKEETFYWHTEAGYRFTVENRRSGQVNQSYLRFYTEANRDWTKTFSTKFWLEYLPNLTISEDYQINTEFTVSAALNEIFAIKTGYLVKYRHLLIAPATVKTDSQFTTALVAKF